MDVTDQRWPSGRCERCIDGCHGGNGDVHSMRENLFLAILNKLGNPHYRERERKKKHHVRKKNSKGYIITIQNTNPSFHSHITTLSIRRWDTRQHVVLPREPGGERLGTIRHRHIGSGCLGIPDPGCPRPAKSNISDTGGRSRQSPLKRSEHPSAL